MTTTWPAEGVDVVLRDGSTVHVRTGVPQDAELVTAFFARLSDESRYLRFATAAVNHAAWATHALEPVEGRLALVALRGSPPTVVALGELAPIDAEHAEVAFAVDDARRGEGLATILLAHLAEAAAAAGVLTLQAQVMTENHRMLGVFRSSGLPVTVTFEGSTSIVQAPAALSPQALAAFERREAQAAAGALATVLAPSSVAVVGASSRRADAVGSRVLANLVGGGYTGRIEVVNRRGGTVGGHEAVTSLGALTDPVDLVVVAVPAGAVLDVARDAAAIGARALLVLSAGFGETGPEGTRLQEELLSICRDAGMRLVGPNCLGVLNTDPAVRLNATFATAVPPHGSAGLMSQSGAVGIALLERAAARGLGISSFVSAGNKADLSGNDVLQYWERDPATSVVLLYLESFGNPRNFGRIARRVARTTPIVALKSGRTDVGARAAASHTGALVAASDVSVDALFRHAGVIRAGTVAEFLDLAELLERQPLPTGDRVAIITNAGGPGILCADAAIAAGLTVPEPPAKVADRLRRDLPATASVRNPIDMIATADPKTFARTVETVIAGDWVDALIVISVKVGDVPGAEFEAAVRAALAQAPVPPPLLWVDMSAAPGAGAPSTLPAFAFPEDAARALGHVAGYARWRREPEDPPPDLDGVRRRDASHLLAERATDTPRWLDPDDVAELCRCWGIPLVASETARDVRAAVAAADRIGYPVALKAVAPGLTHKTEAGGVRVGLGDEAHLRAAVAAMRRDVRRAGFRVAAFVVQAMVPDAVEMLVGVTNDPRLGPLVVCGAGGTRAEIERDVAVRLAPIGHPEAVSALRGLRTFPLLQGWRGAPPCDVDALADLVVRTSALAAAHPEVLELDFNPVAASDGGAIVLDARVRVARPAPAAPWPAVGASPPSLP